MANPIIVIIPENVTTKVATSVNSVVLNRSWVGNTLSFYATYRQTGELSPTEEEMDLESVEIFQNATQVAVSSDTLIDVYVKVSDGAEESAKIIVWS